LEEAPIELSYPIGIDFQFPTQAKQPRVVHLKQGLQQVGGLHIAVFFLVHGLQGHLQALLYVVGHGGVVHNERVPLRGIESRTPPNPGVLL
jgi:hypothetical protein